MGRNRKFHARTENILMKWLQCLTAKQVIWVQYLVNFLIFCNFYFLKFMSCHLTRKIKRNWNVWMFNKDRERARLSETPSQLGAETRSAPN